MYDIALCEDSPTDAATIQNILDDYEECTDDALRVRCFPDAESLTGCMLCAGYRPDLILTDIHLPGMSGVDAVRRLRDEGFSGGVIFITSSRAYALDAWELHASQYFVKPVKPADIFAALGSILPRRKYLIVRQKKALRKIPFSEILYCETRGKHQAIITRSEEILVRSTSHDMKKKFLPPPPRKSNFTDLGVTYLVNLENVRMLHEGRVVFDGGKELMLSRRRFMKVKRDFMNM